MSKTSGVEDFLPLITSLFVVPKVISFRLVDYEVEALELLALVLLFFNPLVPELITMGKLLVGFGALGAVEFGLANFSL